MSVYRANCKIMFKLKFEEKIHRFRCNGFRCIDSPGAARCIVFSLRMLCIAAENVYLLLQFDRKDVCKRLVIFTFFLVSSHWSFSATIGTHTKEQFRDYWYPKGAEISRFALKQSRYGEMHKGNAVLIFVTETMNPDLQVKADKASTNAVPILKLNATRKFYTGIYPYSIMTSVFAPIDLESFPTPLKITFTSQEWCGQVFMQMNLKNSEYQVESRSYFESESDRNFRVGGELNEDGLWTQIRIAPSKLPIGEFKLLPGTTYTRLLHRPFVVQTVIGKVSEAPGKSPEGGSLVTYEVRFSQESRIFKITFEKEFPYRIQEWTDTHKSLSDGKNLTTRAVRTHTIMTDYWNKNKNHHRGLLQQLGLHDE